MEFITDIAALEGKTVSKAVSVDLDESIVLIFTDDTCAFFDVEFFFDSHTLVLSSDADDYLKRDAGIISIADFERKREVKQAAHNNRVAQIELSELARLKAKYET